MRKDQNEMMSASSATVSVPAAGPKRRTDVKTNVSETDTVAGNEGKLTVADPLTRVNRARIVQLQPMSCRYNCANDWTIMNEPPATTSAI